jgi:branched-chain amino acid aminotransferase
MYSTQMPWEIEMPTFSIDGHLCSKADATISVMDHGLLYGDGIFEGLRFYEGEIYELDAHLDRLLDSARAISLAIPLQRQEILNALDKAVLASGLADGYIRLLVTRGEGSLGLDPASCARPRLIVIVDELAMVSPAVLAQGATLIISSVRRLQADQIDSRIKSLNYLNQILARLEANAVGADEAVMLNDQGRIAEGTADNIFIVKNGKLSTPPLSEGSLAGITRSAIINCARQTGIEVQETPLSAYDLYTADECFLSGTGAELIPVKEVSGRQITNVRGPIFRQLHAAFCASTRGVRLAMC